MRREPRNKFRLLRESGGAMYFATQRARDAAGPRIAARDGADVVGERWRASNPQDALNRGWGCDAIFKPEANR